MHAERSSSRAAFQALLNAALAHGRITTQGCGLGPRTQEALHALTHVHPEVTAELIAHTYDVFLDEHGETDPT